MLQQQILLFYSEINCVAVPEPVEILQGLLGAHHLVRVFLGDPSIGRPFEVIADLDIFRGVEDISHDDEVDSLRCSCLGELDLV